MMLHELMPKHKIGDIVVYRDSLSLEGEEILVQVKILEAKAELEDGEWVWSYQVQSMDGDLVVYLEDTHIVFNLSNDTAL